MDTRPATVKSVLAASFATYAESTAGTAPKRMFRTKPSHLVRRRMIGASRHKEDVIMPLYFLDPGHVVLERWSIRERDDTGERHFVGFDTVNNDGRVSSPIRTFDPITRTGSTATGSTYQLVGRAGHDRDAEYVWSRVVKIWQIKNWRDVTPDLVPNRRQALPIDKSAQDD